MGCTFRHASDLCGNLGWPFGSRLKEVSLLRRQFTDIPFLLVTRILPALDVQGDPR
jgi:hypothetical protein